MEKGGGFLALHWGSNPPGLRRRCRRGEWACQHPGTPSCSLYPSTAFIPLSLSLHPRASLHSHIPQIKWQVEREQEGGKAEVAAVARWVKPTAKALISVSPSLMCTRQNPFVSHLLPWFGPDSLGWAVEDMWQSDGGEDEGKQRDRGGVKEYIPFIFHTLLFGHPLHAGGTLMRVKVHLMDWISGQKIMYSFGVGQHISLSRLEVQDRIISTLLANL